MKKLPLLVFLLVPLNLLGMHRSESEKELAPIDPRVDDPRTMQADREEITANERALAHIFMLMQSMAPEDLKRIYDSIVDIARRRSDNTLLRYLNQPGICTSPAWEHLYK